METCSQGRGGDADPSPSRAGSSGTGGARLLPSSHETRPPDTPTLPSECSCPVDRGFPSSTQRPVAIPSENVGSRWTLQGAGPSRCSSLPGSNACPRLTRRQNRPAPLVYLNQGSADSQSQRVNQGSPLPLTATAVPSTRARSRSCVRSPLPTEAGSRGQGAQENMLITSLVITEMQGT